MHLNQVLIVNFDFPPNQGIGGRRWGKLAKQLAREGYLVHVIKADPVANNIISIWSDDVVHENIIVHSLPRKYPEILSHPKSGLLNKLLYRLAKWKMQTTEAGTIYDISSGWNKVFTPFAEALIAKHGIINVMATGAPWNVLLYTVRLKDKFPSLNIVVDYRDPWLNARNYGMQGLSPKRKAAEEEKQKQVLKLADVVITPYHYLTEELRNFSKTKTSSQARFEVLTHFYDSDDWAPKHEPKKDEKVVIVYAGDLYYELDKELERLRLQLLQIKKNRPELYERVDCRIYTGKPNHAKFADVSAVKMLPSIGKQIQEVLQKAHYALVLLSHSKRNDRTTKFFEYLPLRIPMLVIADEGEVTNFVRTHLLGEVIDEESNTLEQILERALNGTTPFNAQFDISPFSLQQAARQLISYLK